jgi:hypothetical protein|tara:strand:- start:1762 stop:2004 length:243 start_codon:yes stop_codon:yes gene_type:complete
MNEHINYNSVIYIHGVTQSQKAMLDTIWSFRSYHEYVDWFETLTTSDQQQADLLRILVLLELSDQVENVDQAKEIINMVK